MSELKTAVSELKPAVSELKLKTVGKNETRVDVRAKVTGRATYAADLQMPSMLYGKVVRCMEYAHARVKKLDLSEAAKIPGVVKVLGPQDVTQKQYNQTVVDLMAPEPMAQMMGDIDDQTIFTDHVRHQGDSIAAIIATSEEIAERAAEKVIVEYEPLPVYLTAEQASQPGAMDIEARKPGNRAFQLPEQMFPNNEMGFGDVETAFAEADLIVEDTFYTNKHKQCQMEPNAYVALYDDQQRLNCWTSCQMPKLAQRKLSTLFELPMTRVKINQTVVGGGFGARLGIIAEAETCAMAMAVPGRPIKVQQSRAEDWLTSPSRHPGDYWMKIGFKKDGTPVAVDAKFTAFKGGYYLDSSAVLFCAGRWLSSLYRWESMRYKAESYYTNTSACGAYRGYGNPQSSFVTEQLIDRACEQLGIDPLKWRRKWHKSVGEDSWLQTEYASCALDECIDRGAEAINWKEKRAQNTNQSGVKRRGVGVATGTHTSGAAPMILEHTTCTVRLNEDATATLNLACSDLGQGSHTALRQIAAEALGFGYDDVYLATGDSDTNGFDIGAHASRTLFVGGTAVKMACEDARRQLLKRAAKALGVSDSELVMEQKKIFVESSPEKVISAEQICRDGVYNFPNPETGQPDGEPGQILGYASHLPKHNSPPFSATFVEVEVDTETGEVTVLDLVNTYDIGRAINPAIVEGQLEGGAQQGLGMGLTEEMYYNEAGLNQNAGFTDYKMLGPSDMPKMTNILVEHDDPHGPYGAKSVGELVLVTPLSAVANAIYNAIGVQITEAPITPEKILRALSERT